MLYENGDRFSGEWSGDLKNGKGVYEIIANKQIVKGVWIDGLLVSGEWILENGNKFVGDFRSNQPFGQG